MPKQWITDHAEMEEILHNCDEGSLATVCPDGSPYIVVVNYVYRDGRIYFHSASTGKKMENISQDSRVCFSVYNVDKIARSDKAINFGTRYRSVIVNGQARLLDDPATKLDVLMLLTAKYAEDQTFEPPTVKQVAGTAVAEIEIENMTGKRNVDS